MAGSVADDNPDMVRMGDGADGVWKAGRRWRDWSRRGEDGLRNAGSCFKRIVRLGELDDDSPEWCFERKEVASGARRCGTGVPCSIKIERTFVGSSRRKHRE